MGHFSYFSYATIPQCTVDDKTRPGSKGIGLVIIFILSIILMYITSYQMAASIKDKNFVLKTDVSYHL